LKRNYLATLPASEVSDNKDRKNEKRKNGQKQNTRKSKNILN
jgi:hypothetical protein